ncbi:MAG: hypothetical protein JXA33_22745, partial [Anaerolineae bacterium]|nr:hypothetical protein [Anaerolineae bacterium]
RSVFANHNVISDNQAEERGGGLYISGSATKLSSLSVFNNHAEQSGGGMFFYNSTDQLRESIVATNTAIHEGGGIYVSSSNALTLTHNSVFNNNARIDGGGLYLRSSPVTLDRNIIVGNIARDHGGGLLLEKSDASLKNTVVVDNEAGVNGAGLYIEACAPRLVHSTITHNAGGDGTGIYVTDDGWGTYSNVALTNTILIGYQLGIVVTKDNRVSSNATLWGTQQSIFWGGEGTLDRSNDVWGDAVLVDTYHIIAGSAALEAGVVTEIRNDIDGEPRPYQEPDLGADEYWPAGSLKYAYLPLVTAKY